LLEGKVGLITGASSGIGEAIAKALSNHGVSLYLVGRNMEKLKNLSDLLVKKTTVRIFNTDVARDEDINRLSAYLIESTRRLDILVHSAGHFIMGGFEEVSIDDLDILYRINVRAPFLITKNLLPLIKAAKGQIVFINSTAGLQARAGVSQYAATKHALKAIADSLREEVNTYGVRVISIYPGRTATPMQISVHKMEGRTYRPDLLMQPGDVAETVINALKLPETAEVTDIYIRPMKKIQ